ncbi:MAG: AraC family transcriptional regulator [Lachnospiraceae bacterium]|nr:AraC family transcriptional regulator [Lachnospiraceae bacterium]
MEESSKTLAYRDYIQREEMFVRAPYNPEVEFYSYIMSGDTAMVEKLTEENFLAKRGGWGRLSENELQNVKYHLVITAAVIARYCINAGLPVQTAYNLSDHYIMLADKCKTVQAVADLHKPLCMDYAKRMRSLQKNAVHSIHIVRCMDYIYDRLHTRITVKELAAYSGLSEAYLCRLFKEQTGSSISDYITKMKISTAKNMLLFSDYPIAEISSILAFPSQSYFTRVFKKECAVTPLEYRHTRGI